MTVVNQTALVAVYLHDAKEELYVFDLTKASESFKRLRGDNMERMIQNDELCPELVMFVRLHLLNAIFAYHTGDTSGSVQWLKRVEQEIHRTSLVRVCRCRWKLCDPLARIHR